MSEDQIREVEKRLGRRLTPQEKRLLRYSDVLARPSPAEKQEKRPKKRPRSQSAPHRNSGKDAA